MKNIFKWASRWSPKMSEHPGEASVDESVCAEDIPEPDIYGESDTYEPTVPNLRIIGESFDSDNDGFDPYDTAVLVEK